MSLLKHLPNLLSLSRALVTPFLILAVLHGRYPLALVLFAVACLSDFLDGAAARRLDARSRLGGFLDPVCDKFLSLSLFSLLMVLGKCPPWFLGLLFAVTLLQAMGLALLQYPSYTARPPFQSLRSGKRNTALQFLFIAIVLVDLSTPKVELGPVGLWVGYLVLSFAQVTVFFRYITQFHSLLGKHFSILFDTLIAETT